MHDLTDRGIGLGCNMCKFAFVLHDFEESIPSNDLLSTAIWPDHFVRCLFSIWSEAVDAQVLRIAICNRIDETIPIDNISINRLAIKPLEARRHQQCPCLLEMTECSLVGLGSSNMRFIDDDQIDIR